MADIPDQQTILDEHCNWYEAADRPTRDRHIKRVHADRWSGGLPRGLSPKEHDYIHGQEEVDPDK